MQQRLGVGWLLSKPASLAKETPGKQASPTFAALQVPTAQSNQYTQGAGLGWHVLHLDSHIWGAASSLTCSEIIQHEVVEKTTFSQALKQD